jgi:hypothetical protein
MQKLMSTYTRSRKRLLPAWLALLALVLQTVVPLGQMLHAAQSEDTIYICTSSGIVPLHQKGPAGNTSEMMADCQVCTVGLFGSGYLTADLVPSAPVFQVLALRLPVGQTGPQETTLNATPARGPPTIL